MTRRPRILLLAYHFPPMGGAGAQRAVKLTRRLVERGWDPVVVTRSAGRDERFNPRDAQLAAEIPAGVAIHRVAGTEPHTSQGWSSRMERLLGRIDARTHWWSAAAIEAALRIEGPLDLVHAFLEPYGTASAAAILARRLDVPWIADLQDPWALDETRVHITGLHLAQDRRRMRRALRGAAAIVMNTDEAARVLVRDFSELAARPVHAIPNGFDAREWREPAPRRDDSAFRIVHAGTLHTELGIAHRRSRRLRRLLRGRIAPVDMLTRSHVLLLEALDALITDRPELADRIELHLAGVLSDTDLELAGGRSYVRARGFLTHADTVRLIRSADLLFLPMHDLPRGARARIVPCKAYEYLASERPILAAVPDGDARAMLAAASGVHLCRPADVSAMRAAVATEIDRPTRAVPRLERIGRFERDALADELVAVFDAALRARRRHAARPSDGQPVASPSPVRP